MDEPEDLRSMAEKAVEIGNELSMKLCALRDGLVSDGLDLKTADAICMNAAIEQLATTILLAMGGGKLPDGDFVKIRDFFNREMHESVHKLMAKYGRGGKSTFIEIQNELEKEEEENGTS